VLDGTSTTRPSVPSGSEEFFLSNNLTVSRSMREAGLEEEGAQVQGLIYRPALLAQSSIRFLDRSIDLDHLVTRSCLVREADRRGVIRWEDYSADPISDDELDHSPVAKARYSGLEPPLNDAKLLRSLKADFADFLYRSATLRLWENEGLDLVRQQCDERAKELRDNEIAKLKKTYEKKADGLKSKLSREERELAQDQAEHSARKMEEMITHAENLFSLFGGSRRTRRFSSSMTKRRLASQAKADVEESLDAIDEYQQQLESLEQQLADELDELDQTWTATAEQIGERVVTPYKKYILSDYFGIVWIPHWIVLKGDEMLELPGHQAG
jgi:hypothetical protein